MIGDVSRLEELAGGFCCPSSPVSGKWGPAFFKHLEVCGCIRSGQEVGIVSVIALGLFF